MLAVDADNEIGRRRLLCGDGGRIELAAPETSHGGAWRLLDAAGAELTPVAGAALSGRARFDRVAAARSA